MPNYRNGEYENHHKPKWRGEQERKNWHEPEWDGDEDDMGEDLKLISIARKLPVV